MVEVRRWAAMTVHPPSAGPVRFAARLVGSHLAPRAARLPAGRAAATSAGAALAAGCAALPGRWRPDDQALLDGVVAEWPHLFVSGSRPSALVVERSAARTMFVFADDAHPVAVAKVPRGDRGRVEAEEAALARARPAAMAPAPLGWVAGAFVQEGVPGQPPAVPALAAPDVPAAPWPGVLAELADALARLGAATATAGSADDDLLPLDAALADPGLSPVARSAAEAAVRDLRAGAIVRVLRHGDLSPQNWLVDGERMAGVVDWETAVALGMPGFDVLHAAVTWLELSVVGGGGDEEAVAAGFDMAWASAPLFEGARRAADAAAEAAGWPSGLGGALVVGFFVRRLGRRLHGGGFGRDIRLARRMLDVVARG